MSIENQNEIKVICLTCELLIKPDAHSNLNVCIHEMHKKMRCLETENQKQEIIIEFLLTALHNTNTKLIRLSNVKKAHLIQTDSPGDGEYRIDRDARTE